MFIMNLLLKNWTKKWENWELIFNLHVHQNWWKKCNQLVFHLTRHSVKMVPETHTSPNISYQSPHNTAMVFWRSKHTVLRYTFFWFYWNSNSLWWILISIVILKWRKYTCFALISSTLTRLHETLFIFDQDIACESQWKHVGL